MKLEMVDNAVYKDGEKQYEFDAFEQKGESMVFYRDEVEVGSLNASLLQIVPLGEPIDAPVPVEAVAEIPQTPQDAFAEAMGQTPEAALEAAPAEATETVAAQFDEPLAVIDASPPEQYLPPAKISGPRKAGKKKK